MPLELVEPVQVMGLDPEQFLVVPFDFPQLIAGAGDAEREAGAQRNSLQILEEVLDFFEQRFRGQHEDEQEFEYSLRNLFNGSI